MKKILLSILIVVTIITITGCGKKEENNSSTKDSSNSIIGTWEYKAKAYNYIWVFNNDKTCSYDAAGAFSNCTYEIDGDHLYVTYSGEDKPWDYTYILDGDKLKIVFAIGDKTYYRK